MSIVKKEEKLLFEERKIVQVNMIILFQEINFWQRILITKICLTNHKIDNSFYTLVLKLNF